MRCEGVRKRPVAPAPARGERGARDAAGGRVDVAPADGAAPSAAAEPSMLIEVVHEIQDDETAEMRNVWRPARVWLGPGGDACQIDYGPPATELVDAVMRRGVLQHVDDGFVARWRPEGGVAPCKHTKADFERCRYCEDIPSLARLNGGDLVSTPASARVIAADTEGVRTQRIQQNHEALVALGLASTPAATAPRGSTVAPASDASWARRRRRPRATRPPELAAAPAAPSSSPLAEPEPAPESVVGPKPVVEPEPVVEPGPAQLSCYAEQRWSTEEESLLKNLVAELGSASWSAVAERLGTGRTPSAVEYRWYSNASKASYRACNLCGKYCSVRDDRILKHNCYGTCGAALGVRAAPFPRVLKAMIDNASHDVAAWSADGRIFVVRDLQSFCKDWTVVHNGSRSKFTYFHGLLIAHQFRPARLQTGQTLARMQSRGALAYYHATFVRDANEAVLNEIDSTSYRVWPPEANAATPDARIDYRVDYDIDYRVDYDIDDAANFVVVPSRCCMCGGFIPRADVCQECQGKVWHHKATLTDFKCDAFLRADLGDVLTGAVGGPRDFERELATAGARRRGRPGVARRPRPTVSPADAVAARPAVTRADAVDAAKERAPALAGFYHAELVAYRDGDASAAPPAAGDGDEPMSDAPPASSKGAHFTRVEKLRFFDAVELFGRDATGPQVHALVQTRPLRSAPALAGFYHADLVAYRDGDASAAPPAAGDGDEPMSDAPPAAPRGRSAGYTRVEKLRFFDAVELFGRDATGPQVHALVQTRPLKSVKRRLSAWRAASDSDAFLRADLGDVLTGADGGPRDFERELATAGALDAADAARGRRARTATTRAALSGGAPHGYGAAPLYGAAPPPRGYYAAPLYGVAPLYGAAPPPHGYYAAPPIAASDVGDELPDAPPPAAALTYGSHGLHGFDGYGFHGQPASMSRLSPFAQPYEPPTPARPAPYDLPQVPHSYDRGGAGGTCLDKLQSLGAAKISRLMANGIATVEALAKVDPADYGAAPPPHGCYAPPPPVALGAAASRAARRRARRRREPRGAHRRPHGPVAGAARGGAARPAAVAAPSPEFVATASFPEKVSDLVNRYSDVPEDEAIVSWCEDGRAFIVRDRTRFCEEVLPAYFSHNKWASFTRMLNLYGFKCIKLGRWVGTYEHECFRRGEPQLLQSITLRRRDASAANTPTTTAPPEPAPAELDVAHGLAPARVAVADAPPVAAPAVLKRDRSSSGSTPRQRKKSKSPPPPRFFGGDAAQAQLEAAAAPAIERPVLERAPSSSSTGGG
ncbi:hypothetical protein JL720_15101 [Aureococcus anophagefferens]|nr:hypothetical protein JL720_15101 [Aureococcus anophagefferens]